MEISLFWKQKTCFLQNMGLILTTILHNCFFFVHGLYKQHTKKLQESDKAEAHAAGGLRTAKVQDRPEAVFWIKRYWVLGNRDAENFGELLKTRKVVFSKTIAVSI